MTDNISHEIFAENLRYYMERYGKTQQDLLPVVGVAASTFSDWCNGKKYPRIDKVQKLADYFGIKKSELIEKRNEPGAVPSSPELTPFEVEVLDRFRAMSEEQRKSFLSLLRSLQP